MDELYDVAVLLFGEEMLRDRKLRILPRATEELPHESLVKQIRGQGIRRPHYVDSYRGHPVVPLFRLAILAVQCLLSALGHLVPVVFWSDHCSDRVDPFGRRIHLHRVQYVETCKYD